MATSGPDIERLRLDFCSMILRAKGATVAHFVAWLDLKVAEYKVYGHMILTNEVLAPPLHEFYAGGSTHNISDTVVVQPVFVEPEEFSSGGSAHNIKDTSSLSSPVITESTNHPQSSVVQKKEVGAKEELDSTDYKVAVATFEDPCHNDAIADYSNTDELENTDDMPAPVSSAVQRGPFPCTDCDKIFQTKSGLARHKRDHIGVYPFSCEECQKGFHSATNLTNHQRTKHGEKKFQCSVCPAELSSEGGLRRHEMLHSDCVSICEICSKSFQSKYYLSRHMIAHTSPRLKCPSCPKTYTNQTNLKVHMAVHGERKVTCRYCSFSSVYAKSVRRHEKKHVKGPMVLCVRCGKGFIRKDMLDRHKLKCTAVPKWSKA